MPKYRNFPEYLEELRRIRDDETADKGQAVDALRSELQAHLTEFYGDDRKKIDRNTEKLLKGRTCLTESEINALCGRFSDSPAMLRMISDYCRALGIRNSKAEILGQRARSGGEHELEVFDLAAEWMLSGSDLFSERFGDCRQALADVVVKP